MEDIENLLAVKQELMEMTASTQKPDFRQYSEELPLPADVAMWCQHLDIHGNRCTKVAKNIYTHHGDPELDDGWYAVYVCDEHLKLVMHVSGIL